MITGASWGTGREIARAFAREGRSLLALLPDRGPVGGPLAAFAEKRKLTFKNR